MADGATALQPPRNPAAHLAEYKWGPGQSGNPNGRRLGSRNQLAEHFLEDCYEAWQELGKEALAKVAANDPSTFVKVIASLMPKELHIIDKKYEGVSDDELFRTLDAIRALLALGATSRPNNGSEAKAIEQEPNNVQ